MKYLAIIIIFGSILLGCEEEKRPDKPDDLIPREEMVSLLYDIQILNSAKSVNKKLLENRGVNPQEYIFKKYDIDSARFARSNEYYSYEPETYEKILDEVQNRLDSLENYYNDLYKQQEEQDAKKRDSLKRIRDRIKDSVMAERKLKDEGAIPK